MGCTSCSTGKPTGCKSNGGCSTGGCNRLNVHDWLANLPFSDLKVVAESLKFPLTREAERIITEIIPYNYFEKGDIIAVEGVSGFDVGTVSLTGELVGFN